jgi:superfamily II DNA or RNA helicase
MILRPRQEEFSKACISALKEYNNTLGVAPTGAGKTVMLSAVIDRMKPDNALILQHRDELVDQNRATFKKISDRKTDLMVANRKNFLSDGATFAMVQTLVRNLDQMKPVDLLAIDECHHVAADSYQRIIERARELNPKTRLFGVSATPMRADKKALTNAFSNVGDVISITELIQGGHLVKPRTFVIDCGLREELKGVHRTAADFDMAEVEEIMDKAPITGRVISEWKNHAGDRRTIVFASTVEHAQHVTDAFKNNGIKAELVHGAMGEGDRKAVLKRLDRGETQVVCNVAVLTEGFDCQPVSCVILLRPCSHKSTMLQMIGRGLRKVDQERYPGIRKDDCVILDFGYSLLTHGTLETDIELSPKKGEAKRIPCPSCGTEVPANVRECPVCGHEINPIKDTAEGGDSEREDLVEFGMTEIELLDVSPFRWEAFFEGKVVIANGLTAWAALVNYGNRWIAVCQNESEGGKVPAIIANTCEKVMALSSADDFLREHGDRSNARKSRSWLSMPPSDKQRQMLNIDQFTPMSRYRASCAITWRFAERRIQLTIENMNKRNMLNESFA